MPRKNGRRSAARRRVYFELQAAGATCVSLVGNFNGWNPESHPLKPGSGETWRRYLVLEPGMYEYRFLVDGEWRNDSAAQRVPNPYGTENCVRMVS